MTSTKKNNQLPPALVSSLQEALLRKNARDGNGSKKIDESREPASFASSAGSVEDSSTLDSTKPVILVTNSDGIDSCGLTYLVDALDRQGLYTIFVCVPQCINSFSGHSITVGQTVQVSSVEIKGAIGYEVSGTPADCISLALSGILLPFTKPLLVVSGINKGSCCGSNVFYSGSVAGAREALFCNIPSLSLSLNWKKNESQEASFKDAVTICLPLINAAARDIKEGFFPERCSLKVEIPSYPLENKGLKFTRQSGHRIDPAWQVISSSRAPAPPSMSSHQSLALQLAKLSRDASAAGAARRESSQRKSLEIESTGASEKSESNRAVKKYFRLEFLEKERDSEGDDEDFKALESGFIVVTPLHITPHAASDTDKAAALWVSNSLGGQL